MCRWPDALIDLYSRTIARRFQAESAKTFFANTVSKDPVVVSNVVRRAPTRQWTEPPPLQAAFAVHVLMKPLPKFETRTSGRYIKKHSLSVGDVTVLDLAATPISLIEDPMDSVRIQITQRTLDELAYENNLRPIRGLRATFGVNDQVLLGLSTALLRQSEIYGSDNPLFLDNVAVALFSHLARSYGGAPEERPARGGLAPWQFRRARELMTARLAEGVNLADLAETCGLSAGYFSRAFRRSAGIPAHKWLTNERVRRAKILLEDPARSLAEVAIECGFSDQSHLTRVFSHHEGQTPARWRRLRADG